VGHSRASRWKVNGRERWGWEERAPDDENDERHRDFSQRRRLSNEEGPDMQSGGLPNSRS
jgi:hypothetical protein